VVTREDFEFAIKSLPPSIMRGSLVDEIPQVTWDDIGGLETVKQQLVSAVEWPLRYGETYKRLGLHPPRGILLHGPPGCAKTTLVKAVANCCRASFLSLPAATVFSPFLGDAERTVREAFQTARRARPSIIFFDEIDALVAKRSFGSSDQDEGVQTRVLSTLLNCMDGVEQAEDILVIGATNRLDMIDPALLRPGRFDKILRVPLPDMTSRRHILNIHTRGMPLDGDVDISNLAQLTQFFSGADLENMCREAALAAMKDCFDQNCPPNVNMGHFRKAFESLKSNIRPTTQAFEFIPP